MAISNAIPKLWSARIYEAFEKFNVWAPLVSDVSGEVVSGGSSVSFANLTGDVTVSNYVVGTDISDAEDMDDAEDVLSLDQQKYFNIKVDDVDRIQMKPDLFSKWTRAAGLVVAKTVSSFIYGVAFPAHGTIATGNKGTTANITTTTGAAGLQTFVDLIQATANHTLPQKGWPQGEGAIVVPTDIHAAMIKYLIIRGALGSGSIVDDALTRGALSQWFGLPVVPDPNMPTTAASNRDLAVFIHPDAVYAAYQINQTEAYRLEKQFADGVKGLFVYGAKLMDGSKTHSLLQT